MAAPYHDIIVAFLQAKGLHTNAIRGILGNLQVESGYNPNALNAGEGAIGIAQWEGSRRTALQNYAAATGGKETSITTQLGFLWKELNGTPGLFGQLQSASTLARPQPYSTPNTNGPPEPREASGSRRPTRQQSHQPNQQYYQAAERFRPTPPASPTPSSAR